MLVTSLYKPADLLLFKELEVAMSWLINKKWAFSLTHWPPGNLSFLQKQKKKQKEWVLLYFR